MTAAAVLDTRDLERAIPGVHVPAPPRTGESQARESQTREDQTRNQRLRGLVDTHIDFVARVLRNSGTPHAEIDDEVQRTFIVAARRLDDIRLGAEKSFLFRIAYNLAAHARRTAARRREVAADQAPEQVERFATPEALTDQKRMRELLDGVLDQMDENLRATFVLHEFEEMSTAEIAEALGIPRGTVASRLRRARSEFRERVAAIEGFGYVDREGQG
ncbi:MAG TPA: sigma-70 family RNA polymerase sigma factor [Polyangia bacterium]|jgi:RNA polymerase sigma-70 factor (ECF subfamily)|nr:sigma-70 family RNA polymerase sigma factor [Polyangia bacterium]